MFIYIYIYIYILGYILEEKTNKYVKIYQNVTKIHSQFDAEAMLEQRCQNDGNRCQNGAARRAKMMKRMKKCMAEI